MDLLIHFIAIFIIAISIIVLRAAWSAIRTSSTEISYIKKRTNKGIAITEKDGKKFWISQEKISDEAIEDMK